MLRWCMCAVVCMPERMCVDATQRCSQALPVRALCALRVFPHDSVIRRGRDKHTTRWWC